MAALATYHQHAKRPKTSHEGVSEGLSNPPMDVIGVTNALMAAGRSMAFLMKGDRHFWEPETETAWKNCFHPEHKHPTKTDKRGKPVKTISGAPFQVYTVGLVLEFLGKTYGPAEQARWILKHMVSKKWLPLAVFNFEIIFDQEGGYTEDSVDQMLSDFDVNMVPEAQLLELHSMLLDFTQRVSGVHYHELVMGNVDPKPTKDKAKVLDTLYAESDEEAGLTKDHVNQKSKFFGWSDPYRGCVNAIFVTDFADPREMVDIWQAADDVRRPPGAAKWRCPHAWFKGIPGIDKEAGKIEKSYQETRDGAWHSIVDIQNRPNFVDSKNLSMLAKILG